MIGLGLSVVQIAVRQLLGFDPKSLFAASEPGVWYDPSDFSTMFQDAAGTTPVTAVEQPVGLILDKSKGLVLGPELVTNGTFDTNTAGWTAGSGATLAVVSQRLVVTNPAGGTNRRAFQAITCVIGATYRIDVGFVDGTAGGRIGIGTTAAATEVFQTGVPFGSFSRVFVATATTMYIGLAVQSATAGDTATFDNISVRELPGNHATQTTATSRPVLSARYNLLTKTEQFDDAAWGVQAATITANSTAAPNGTSTADTFTETSSSGDPRLPVNVTLVTGSAYSLSVYAKVKPGSSQRYMMLVFNAGFSSVGGVNFNLVTGSVGAALNAAGSIESVGNGWYRCSITPNTTATTTSGSLRIRLSNVDTVSNIGSPDAYTGDGTSGIYIWGASLVPANQASLPYQRVNTATDYDADPSKFKPYLRFDGVDDWLVTPTITPDTDKAQVFAGVRKLSDAATGMPVEFSTDAGSSSNSGSFHIQTSANTYGFALRGTGVGLRSATTYTAPVSNVLSVEMDIGQATLVDELKPRINGSVPTLATTLPGPAGTGNFLAYPLYIGRRGGTTLPFNGHIYGLIVRFGANLPAGTIASTETWLNQRTGAY